MDRKEDGKKTLNFITLNIIISIISIVLSLISTVILTRIVSVADLGIATSFSSLQEILSIVCLMAIQISINRMLLDVKNNEYKYLSSIYIFSTLISFIFFAVYLLFAPIFNEILGFSTKLMCLMFSIVILSNGCTILTTYWNFKNKYKLYFVHSIFSLPISQILSLILSYLFIKDKYMGRILGISLFNMIIGMIYGIFILLKGKFYLNKKYIMDSLKISVPMVPHLLSQIVLASSDLLMVNRICGSSDAGLYSMAYTISNILLTVLLQIFKPWSTWFYRRLNNNEVDSIKFNSRMLMLLSAYFCVGLFTVAPDMIKIFLPASYISSSYIVAPICIGIFFQIMYTFFYDVEYFHKKNVQIAFFSVIIAIFNIVLNLIFISKYGYQAAAYTTMISYLLLMLLHYLGMKKLEKRHIFDIKYLAKLSMCMIIIFSINLYFNNYFIVRYLFLILFTIYMIIKNKKIFFYILIFIKNRKIGFG